MEKTGTCATLDMKMTSRTLNKRHVKKSMPFVMELGREIAAGEPGNTVLSKELLFDELALLMDMKPTLYQVLHKLDQVMALVVNEDGKSSDGNVPESVVSLALGALPGEPTFFENLGENGSGV
jgi:hypothetical protein